MSSPKAAIWLRVSTNEQHAENQLPDLQEWAGRRGWEVVKVYQVQESAWRGAHLKALSSVYEDAHRGQFNILLVWALDRLSRQGIAATLEIIKHLSQYQVRVLSLQESWTDVEGPMLELLFSIAAWVAKQESDRRSERTKAGMAIARAKGHLLGRPKGAKDKRQRRSAGYFGRYRGTTGGTTSGPGPPTPK